MKRNTDWKRKTRFWAAPWLLIAAALWVGAPVLVPEDTTTVDLADEMARERVIVEFSAPTPALGDEDAALPEEGIADIAARILSRLEPEIRESARVFEFLPLIALEANAETMLQLIAMPEVLAIQPDRVLELLPSLEDTNYQAGSGEITVPDMSDEITLPESSDGIPIPELSEKAAEDDTEAGSSAKDK